MSARLRTQAFELVKADVPDMRCRICACKINKGEDYIIETPSYYNICRQCIKTLFMFMKNHEISILSM